MNHVLFTSAEGAAEAVQELVAAIQTGQEALVALTAQAFPKFRAHDYIAENGYLRRKPSLRVQRRMERIEKLPPHQQNHLLR